MVHQVTLSCIHCGHLDLVKFGFASNGTQRYRCKSCQKTFMAHYTKEAYKPGVKEKIIDMALDGVGIRATSRLLGVDQNTVMSTLLKKNR